MNPDLTLPGYPEVFVVGDMISLNNLPGVAQVAIQGSKYAAHEIQRRLKDKPPQRPFKYFDKGNLATISRFDAVLAVGKIRMTGFLAWLVWLGVHLIYLTGFKNQVTALHALDRDVPEQRPLPTHGDRAADLRPDGAATAARRSGGAGERAGCPVSTVGPSSRRGRPRRPRLTDSGERGRVSDRTA